MAGAGDATAVAQVVNVEDGIVSVLPLEGSVEPTPTGSAGKAPFPEAEPEARRDGSVCSDRSSSIVSVALVVPRSPRPSPVEGLPRSADYLLRGFSGARMFIAMPFGSMSRKQRIP